MKTGFGRRINGSDMLLYLEPEQNDCQHCGSSSDPVFEVTRDTPQGPVVAWFCPDCGKHLRTEGAQDRRVRERWGYWCWR